MQLIDNKDFKLPNLLAGSFSGMDRLYLPQKYLILYEVTQRPDNGNIELKCRAKNGPEQKRGNIRFLVENRVKKDSLYSWLQNQVGKDIETIYGLEFGFQEK